MVHGASTKHIEGYCNLLYINFENKFKGSVCITSAIVMCESLWIWNNHTNLPVVTLPELV